MIGVEDLPLSQWPATRSLGSNPPVHRAVSGTMNHTWIVGDPDDEGGGAFALRLHRFAAHECAAVEREHRVMSLARTSGVPVPQVLPTLQEHPFLVTGDRIWTLYQHAAGTQPVRGTHSPGQAGALGSTLGQVHRVLNDRTLSGALPVSHVAGEDPDELIARLDGLRGLIGRIAPRVESDDWAEQELQGRIEWIRRHGMPRPVPEPEHWMQPIHGDYQDSNVFLGADCAGRDVVCAVIDWDKAQVASRMFEVVRASAYSFEWRAELISAFLDGYREQLDLDEPALATAVWNFHVRDLHGGTWIPSMLYEHRDERVRPLLAPGGFVPVLDRWPL